MLSVIYDFVTVIGLIPAVPSSPHGDDMTIGQKLDAAERMLGQDMGAFPDAEKLPSAQSFKGWLATGRGYRGRYTTPEPPQYRPESSDRQYRICRQGNFGGLGQV